jgi:hypothetical protein
MCSGFANKDQNSDKSGGEKLARDDKKIEIKVGEKKKNKFAK